MLFSSSIPSPTVPKGLAALHHIIGRDVIGGVVEAHGERRGCNDDIARRCRHRLSFVAS